MKYTVPPINTRGVFIFNAPYADDPDINKKEYEVVEIRKIKSFHDDGLDPLNNIYIKHGLTKDDFIEDLEGDVPIITLAVDDQQFLYVPADRIKEMPAIIGYTATERLITLSLGLVPDNINLDTLYENIATMVHDTISIKPDMTEQPGGPTVLISDTDYNNYKKMMANQARSYNKSWRVLYEEQSVRYRTLEIKLEQVEKILQRFMRSLSSKLNR